jgi:thiamine-phosphate pyrophosphorylase
MPSALCAICDADVCARTAWTMVDLAAACLAGGATFLQIRAKGFSSAALLTVTMEVVRHAEGSGALIIVNDRADIARVAAAGGVHVGQDDLPPAAVRRVLEPTAVVGISTHTDDHVRDALRQPVDYVAIGPIFDTRTKSTGYDALGLEAVRRTAAMAGPYGVPVAAIGGITLDTAPAVLEAGAASVAVIGDLLATGDPEARVKQYLRALA